ncbi:MULTISPECIES: hypothetical protein [unclassified Bacillus (in: firmicutes)]|uniref:hypothetical protein n=1 Tax=unclassified Bacillus (in: firmicutes) TaxID=185979 RepID=UPI00232DF970|nr:hypothetical protein [Bacillus sp. BP-3]MDC2864212.1 hypothetical protein [Bacillus sp. BP-3]
MNLFPTRVVAGIHVATPSVHIVAFHTPSPVVGITTPFMWQYPHIHFPVTHPHVSYHFYHIPTMYRKY